VQFAGTFTVWIVAELSASPASSHRRLCVTILRAQPAGRRRAEGAVHAVWETAVFVLNVLAFVMIGMQCRPIWERLDESLRLQYCLVAPPARRGHAHAHCWVMSYNTGITALDRAPRLFIRPADGRATVQAAS